MRRIIRAALFAALLLAITASLSAQRAKDPCSRTSAVGYSDTPFIPGQKWRVHDIARPHPPLVTPAAGVAFSPPPSDAVILFDGTNLSAWVQRGKHGEGRGKLVEPTWKVHDGYVEVDPGAGSLLSKEKFGDIQLHVEWATPAAVCGSSQWSGNSGVMIMGLYEFQILDSLDNVSYADGQAGSIYGQWPPLVNASRGRGEWQSYDIVFEAPRFEGTKLLKPAFATVFHNGVLVQNHREIVGPVAHRRWNHYKAHPPELPLLLQDHDVPVRFRNIWVRRIIPLPEGPSK